MKEKQIKSRNGLWIVIVAAVVLETTACIQYVVSHNAIQNVAEKRAGNELRKAELVIETHTVEMEAAAKMLALLTEKYIDCPDSVYSATRDIVATIDNTSSVAVAYVPGYFPQIGRYFEVCSSRISEDSIYTRQIGSAEHDYTQMEWFRNGLTIDSCWWCEPYMDDSGSQTWVVSCSYPVRGRDGSVVAVVCIDLSLDYLQGLSEYLQVYEESFYSIRSSQGDAIVPIGDTIPGRKYLTFDREISATGWHISIVIPEDVIYADLRRLGIWITLLMFVGLGLIIFIIYRTVRNVRTLVRIISQNERMEGELEVAQTIQNAMLPKVFPPFADRKDLNVYGVVHPAKEVGGDLYDFYVRHDKLFFCVGDVSGKGVPASLVMATTRSLFRSVTAHEENAAAIVAEMNNSLAETNDQNMFITLFLGVLDLKSGLLEYCNAGHNAPVHLPFGDMQCSMLDCLPNLPVGIMKDYPYQVQQTHMKYNDLLFLYTDGLTEAENTTYAQFGEQRMMQALETVCDRQPRAIVEHLQREVRAFVGEAEQSDDLTMLAIRYQQPALIMRSDIQQIPTLAEWVDMLGIPDELNMPVNLALEEIVSNVMLYAYPEKKNGAVLVESWRCKNKICFCVSDSGKPFDPTKRAEADITLSAEEREIGGLGIHLVRQLMDEIRYERVGDRNVLTMVKTETKQD